MTEEWEPEPKKVYATAEEMYKELRGCGCCCYDWDNDFEDLKAMILKEAGLQQALSLHHDKA